MKQRKREQGYALMVVLLIITITTFALSSSLKKSRAAVQQATLGASSEDVQAKVETELANLQTAVEKNLKSVIQSQSTPTTIVGTSGSPTYSILNPSGFSGTGVTFQVVCYQQASSPTCTTDPAINPKYFKISYSYQNKQGVSYSMTKYFQTVVKTTTTAGTPAGTPRPLGTFAAMSGLDLGVGASPNFMASGDVNGDGNMDILTAQENGQIKVLLGNGSGGFTVHPTVIQPGSAVGSVALFDHDGDGKLDLFATHKASNTVWYYPGVGNGTFTAPWSLPNTASTSGGRIFAANFSPTNDTATAKMEFVLTSTGTAYPTAVWGRTGTGAQIANTGTIVNPWAIPNQVDFTDFNKDGFPDMVGAANGLTSVITAGTATGLTTLAGTTRPPYRPPSRSPWVPDGVSPTPTPATQAVVTGDFNKDGCPDVVEAQQSGSAILTPRFGNCTNTISAFTPGTSIVLDSTVPANGGAWLNAKDFDNDGYLDLVSTNPTAGAITVVKGAASGAFGTPTHYSMGTGSLPQISLTIDVNRDGILDIVTCNKGTNSIGVSVQNTSGGGSTGGSTGTTTYSMSSKAMYMGRGKSSIDDALAYLPR